MQNAFRGSGGLLATAVFVSACSADPSCAETHSCDRPIAEQDAGGIDDHAVNLDATGTLEVSTDASPSDVATGDFFISIAQPKLELMPGLATRMTVSVSRTGSVSEDLLIGIDGLPTQLTSSSAVAGPSDAQTTLTIATPIDAPQGPSKVTVTAQSMASQVRKQLPLELFVRGRPGTLDTTFGKGGYAETHVAGVHSNLYDMTVLGDDGIMAVGSVGVGAIDANLQNGFALAKFDSTGQPVIPFGTSGKFSGPIIEGEFANAVLDQGTKGVVVAGHGPKGFVLRRYLPLGGVDAEFGIGGETRELPGAKNFGLKRLLAQSTGKIVAVGTSSNPANATQITAVRYTAHGQLDSSFATGGIAVIPPGQCDTPRDAVMLSDDRVVISATSYPCTDPLREEGLVVRLTATGQLDTTFGTGGKAIKANLMLSAQPLGGDRLLVLESSRVGHAWVGILQPNGTDDATGPIPEDSLGLNVSRLLRQPDGRLVAWGASLSQISLVRFLDDLSFDATFGSNGHTLLPTTTRLFTTRVDFQSDGRLIVAGTKSEASLMRFWVARIWM